MNNDPDAAVGVLDALRYADRVQYPAAASGTTSVFEPVAAQLSFAGYAAVRRAGVCLSVWPRKELKRRTGGRSPLEWAVSKAGPDHWTCDEDELAVDPDAWQSSAALEVLLGRGIVPVTDDDVRALVCRVVSDGGAALLDEALQYDAIGLGVSVLREVAKDETMTDDVREVLTTVRLCFMAACCGWVWCDHCGSVSLCSSVSLSVCSILPTSTTTTPSQQARPRSVGGCAVWRLGWMIDWSTPMAPTRRLLTP